jgi:hypothetical protein
MRNSSSHHRSPAASMAGRTLGALLASVAAVALTVGGMGDARAQVPTVDIQQTCRIAATAMVQLMGGSSLEADQNTCLGSEQRARDSIVKDWATFSAADRGLCVQTDIYLPSYVEWLTCLEMNREARKMGTQPAPYAPVTLPIVRPKVLY